MKLYVNRVHDVFSFFSLNSVGAFNFLLL
jgi:hypothetical protein